METMNEQSGLDSESGPAKSYRNVAIGIICAVALYIVIDTALVFLRPNFSFFHNAESDYGSPGPWAWLMDANFLLRGLLSATVVVVAAASTHCRRAGFIVGEILLSIWALGSFLLAFFPDDPVGTRLQKSGIIHLTIAEIAFVCLVLGAILISLSLRNARLGWPLSRTLIVVSFGSILPLLLLSRAGLGINSFGGMYEKVFLAMGLAWLTLISLPEATHRWPQTENKT